MSDVFRSDGWTVTPSFVPHGATAPVTLLADVDGFTQLAGDPAVAWQTPWSELGAMQLARLGKTLAFFATVDGTRYCWRKNSTADFAALSALIETHGGTVLSRRRRMAPLVVALVVVVASLGGGLVALLRPGANAEIADAQRVLLSRSDFPSGYTSATSGLLSAVIPSSKTVIASSTTTTAPKANSAWAKLTGLYESCLGVSYAKDREFGRAGQEPDYQVSSDIFESQAYGGIQVGTTAQYYRTTAMVAKDTAQMRLTNFGSCFATVNAAMVDLAAGVTLPTSNEGTNYRPLTFIKGFVRGGTVSVGTNLTLVVEVLTQGHYEVTLGALVVDWPKAKGFLSNLTSTLLARMGSSSSVSAL